MRRYLITCSVFLSAPAIAAEPQPVTPTNLTAWSMFVNADWVVKLVMLVLIGSSVLTWAIWIGKSVELRKSRAALTDDMRHLDDVKSLSDVPELKSAAASELVQAATQESKAAVNLHDALSAEAVRERVSIRFGEIEAHVVQAKQSGLSILASVGSTAPFVGLFGTVWGIMNSFIGISKAQTTNLAVVAPGIAEALLATAFGLVAAVPAVLLHNFLTRSSAGYRRMLRQTSSQVVCILSRDIERAVVDRPRSA